MKEPTMQDATLDINNDRPITHDERKRSGLAVPVTGRQSVGVLLGLVPALLIVLLANRTLSPGGVAGGTQRFADVPVQSSFYTPAERMFQLGIIEGHPCGGPNEPCDDANRPYFRWGAAVERGELARLLVMTYDARAANSNNKREEPGLDVQTFADVPPSHPAHRWIEGVAALDQMRGYACGGEGEPCDAERRAYFRPNVEVTRADLTFSLHQADPKIRQLNSIPRIVSFEDVPKDHPFYLYIERVYERGIMSGYACGGCSPPEPCVPPANRSYFRPDAITTNGQVARVLTGTMLER
jgi:hypothetical protein